MNGEAEKKELYIPTKFGSFLCIFESNKPEPGFTVTSPAAVGFVTAGRTLKEAKKMAIDGLEFHCECRFLEMVESSELKSRLKQRITV